MDLIAEKLGIEPIETNFEIKDYKDCYQELDEPYLMRGKNNPMNIPEVRQTHLEIVRTEEYRKKMSEIKKGHVHSDKTKKLMSESAKKAGTGKWNLGREFSEDHKKNMKISALKRERITCNKCGNGYTKANFKKHYNSCEKQKS